MHCVFCSKTKKAKLILKQLLLNFNKKSIKAIEEMGGFDLARPHSKG